VNKYFQFGGVGSLILLSILGSLLIGFSLEPKVTYAGSLSTNKLVLVPIDATRKGCIQTFKANVNTTHPTIMHRSCPAGTVITTKLVSLTQAIKMHLPYVIPADSNASLSVKQDTQRKMQDMMQKEGQKLLASSTKGLYSPLTACGSNGEYGVNWSPEGDPAYSSTVLFFKSTDCSTIYFQAARIFVNSLTYCEYYWVHDLYAGNYYSVPGEPVLYTRAHLYSHNVSQSAPKGYYYENWVAELASAPNCINGYSYYINIGPIN
jgi:hypothetical protein